MMVKIILYLLISAFFLSGCGSNTLDFKVRYQDIYKLRKKDRVLFEERHIGDVRNVKYTDRGDYLVDISVRKEFTDEITEYSRFYIGSDPQNRDRQSVHMIRIRDGGSPIQENTIIAGTTKYSLLYDQFTAKLKTNLERFETELNDFIEGFQHLSESEQIKQLEKELDRLLAELQYFNDSMKHKLKTEMLPRIKEKIEELRRRLKELGREDDLKYVDRKIEQLTVKLRI